MADNAQILLMERPRGALAESHFASRSAPVPTPGDGQVLVRTVLLSLDAANRAWMQGATYRAALNAGELMSGYGVGEVVESRSPRFARGDVVLGELGWQEWCAADAKGFVRASAHRPLSHQLSVLGVTGKTAYHGLLHVPGIAAGETLLVSAAGGAVGSIVGQIGKIKGARVVGVAGGAEKCAWVVRELGFDACIDYKTGSVREGLKQHCPNGVDIYFDNVGGEILDDVLARLARKARIIICGAISQYNNTTAVQGPKNYLSLLVNRARMEGIVVFDYADRYHLAIAEMAGYLRDGRMKSKEDVVEGGVAAFPGTLGKLFSGENFGKLVLKVADA